MKKKKSIKFITIVTACLFASAGAISTSVLINKNNPLNDRYLAAYAIDDIPREEFYATYTEANEFRLHGAYAPYASVYPRSSNFRDAIEWAATVYTNNYPQQFLNAAYQSLMDEYNPARAFVATKRIEAIGTVSYDSYSKRKIDNAFNYYTNELTDTQKALVSEENKQKLTDAYALYYGVDEVVQEYNALNPTPYTTDFKTAVQLVINHYNNLTTGQKDIFPTNIASTLSDYSPALAVMDKIDLIGETQYTPECKALIDDANSSYEALTANQKSLVANYSILLQDNNDYNEVDGLITRINNIGTFEYTEECKAKINLASATYTLMTEHQKAMVPAAPLKTLKDAEASYNSMEKIHSIGEVANTETCDALITDVRNFYEALTNDQKGMVNAESLKILEDDEKAYTSMNKIDSAIPISFTDEGKAKIAEAKAYYEALTADQKALVKEEYLDKMAYFDISIGAIDKIYAIGDVTFGGDKDSLALINEARSTYDALNPSEQALIGDSDYQLLLDAEVVYKMMKSISEIGEVKYDAASKAKIDAVQDAFNKLTDTQKEEVDNKDILTKAYNDYYSVSNADTLISDIGDITYNADSIVKIVQARKAYNDLSEAEKALFPEAKLNKLIDYETAYNTISKIYEIGEVTTDPASRVRIESARASYNSLSESQKSLVSEKDAKILTDAEAKYAEIAPNNYTWVYIVAGGGGTVIVGLIVFLTMVLRKKKVI